MAEALPSNQELAPAPDISHLVMEDGEPLDGTFQERQMRLLVDALYDSWSDARPFVAQANVGVFYSIRQPAIVPDVLVARDVAQNQDVFDSGRSFLVWEYGKPPDIVVEIVSNTTGREEEKLKTYWGFRVEYAVIFDPEAHLSNRPLRVWVHTPSGYVEQANVKWLPGLELGLTMWKGTYQDVDRTWLRWCGKDGTLLPLGSERADFEAQRADREAQRAEQERVRAEQERVRAEQERVRAEQEAERAERERARADSLAARLR